MALLPRVPHPEGAVTEIGRRRECERKTLGTSSSLKKSQACEETTARQRQSESMWEGASAMQAALVLRALHTERHTGPTPVTSKHRRSCSKAGRATSRPIKNGPPQSLVASRRHQGMCSTWGGGVRSSAAPDRRHGGPPR